MNDGSLADQVRAIIADARRLLEGHESSPRVDRIGARLDGPLRVALAGRVKAGKSTLLNALVGEQVAATDAGECTAFVTWYRWSAGHEVEAVLRDGSRVPLRHRRDERGLEFSLEGRDPTTIDHVEVGVPSPTLRSMVLIDTPGLASIHDENSVRTEQLLVQTDRRGSDADAVVYLMRHVHQRDVAFLEAFMDRGVSLGTPLNALGLLSRADEIGVGRPDALDSARRIAERYRLDPQLRPLVGTVIPVAGLLAETAATLREEEVAALRSLAALPPDERAALVVTADRFRDVHRGNVTSEIRTELLDRLGMFGVRLVLGRLSAEPTMTAASLARELREVSGIAEVERAISERFLPRARILQARSALVALRSIAGDLAGQSPGRAAELVAAVERLEASALDFARLRLLHLVSSDLAALRPGEPDELRALSTGERTGNRAAAAQAVERWHRRMEDPLLDGVTAELCEHTIRLYEAAYAASS